MILLRGTMQRTSFFLQIYSKNFAGAIKYWQFCFLTSKCKVWNFWTWQKIFRTIDTRLTEFTFFADKMELDHLIPASSLNLEKLVAFSNSVRPLIWIILDQAPSNLQWSQRNAVFQTHLVPRWRSIWCQRKILRAVAEGNYGNKSSISKRLKIETTNS